MDNNKCNAKAKPKAMASAKAKPMAMASGKGWSLTASMSMTLALDAQFVEWGGLAMIFAQYLQLMENFLLGYCFQSLCDRIAFAHMNDPNLLLWNKAARGKEICKQLCLRILMNLMIPMSLMS